MLIDSIAAPTFEDSLIIINDNTQEIVIPKLFFELI